MKKFLVAFLMLASGQALLSNDLIHFSESKWSEVTAQAAKDKKYVFLDCYTDWCYWCKVMDKEAFKDTSVTNFINANFIPTKREMEKDPEGIALTMKYHINGFPTYCVFSSEGILVHKIIGYREPAAFLAELKTALTKKDPLVPGFSAALDPGFPKFYKESFGTSKSRKRADPKEVNTFLDGQTDLFSEVAWGVMWRFSLNEKYNNWILGNREKLATLYGAEEVNDKISGIIFGRVDAAATNKNEGEYKEALALVDQYLPEEAGWMKFQMSLTFYSKTGNWTGYADAVQADINANGYQKAGTINGCAWTIYEECDDKNVVARATVWMDSVCTATEEYAYEDTYAALLYKKGDYAKAETVALHAIDLGKTAGENVSGTEALLANIRMKKK